ncbi:tryptophan-rich sensory protein [Dokdonia sp. Hel_I_53]|uniref:tryptophan-rich sensory protein n=1 Tax=Dokdonia sp. Hel_I_53 TaxID=1566287 RepID=UPI00119B06E4|nr:tryptophan-rich sensory protein [Dokdonia sp. Hel_I_53]TVZ53349.1 hypothetical protein OD90_2555 [Dokdonia sp. Hel_I_53]
MEEGSNTIQRFTTAWRQQELLLAFCYAFGSAVFVGFLTCNIWVSCIAFLLVFGIIILFRKPWNITVHSSSDYLDTHLHTTEFSTSLLLSDSNNLSRIAQLQRAKVDLQLQNDVHLVRPQTNLKRAISIAVILIFTGFILSQFYSYGTGSEALVVPEKEKINFQSSAAVLPSYEPPTLESQKLTISYPVYTRKSAESTSSMNAKILEGSNLYWQLDFKGSVRKVEMEGMFSNIEMGVMRTNIGGNSAFAKAYTPKTSGYYNFKFYDSLGASYISDMYAIEIIKDKAPEIKINGLPQFTSFDHQDVKELSFTTEISDDYGISHAAIVATVSKGAGESVKFREERLAFDQPVPTGQKVVTLFKKINLEELKMEIGDELYFYIETSDEKAPKPNIARSETYFAVIKDTVSDSFAVEGTLGADLMPDYFRSQRQLIIDTEKLLKERPTLSLAEFTSRSNALGFDQKALRLKYGQFMGDEDDSGIAVDQEIHMDESPDDDPTAGYRHDHDSENEHNLVEEASHDHDTDENSPLENYVHNHDDPEEATLFTASLRGKLKQAMAEMWDSELHLRLSDPKTSLPYQYRALQLIQEIKNTARIYVHRIGFDPPPIKEEKRLTGEIKDLTNIYESKTIDTADPLSAIRESIEIIENRLQQNTTLSVGDKTAFAKAGQQLAMIAINEPTKHLKTLQLLKWLTEEKPQSREVWKSVQRGLLRALPTNDLQISKGYKSTGSLERMFYKELQQGDR